MKDIQSQIDHRRINIKKVGVKDISYPITVLDKEKKVQRTVANVNMYVDLPHRFKGTHMSRFIEILNRFHEGINLKNFHLILEEMKDRLDAQEAHMELEFPYFLRNIKKSSAIGTSEYNCRMHGLLDSGDDFILEVKVPISPPVPDQESKALPRSLGHWGDATICLRFKNFVWIEDLIQQVEEVIKQSSTSAPRSSLSVENIAKALGNKLSNLSDIMWFSLMVENFSEGYSTFASLEWPENWNRNSTGKSSAYFGDGPRI